MLRKLYRMRWLIRLVSSHTFMVIMACVGVFLGTMQAAGQGTMTEKEALMCTAGAWAMGAYVVALRLAKRITRKW